MKALIPKQQILDAVLMAERITGKKESLPVLSCILIDAQKELVIRATNLEAGIEIKIPCEIEEKGTIAVPAGIFSQTLRSIGGDKVSLKSEESNLLVESRGTKTLIKAIPHEEFPVLSEGKDANNGTKISRDKFLKGIQSAAYAASPSMIRPELGSIFIALKAQGCVFVATDSFRLAEKTISGTVAKDTGEILIPLKHVNEITHLLEKIPSDEVSISVDDFQMTLASEGIRYISRVVDANFPDYKTIIPKQSTTEAVLLKSDLIDMLRKARVFSGSDQHVGLHIYPKKKIFTATARSAEVGEMSDEMEAAVSGEDLDINFHVSYIAECLSSVEADSVTLSFAGPGRPLIIRGVGDGSFMYLVMPLNR